MAESLETVLGSCRVLSKLPLYMTALDTMRLAGRVLTKPPALVAALNTMMKRDRFFTMALEMCTLVKSSMAGILTTVLDTKMLVAFITSGSYTISY